MSDLIRYEIALKEYFSKLPDAKWHTVPCPFCQQDQVEFGKHPDHEYHSLFHKERMEVVRCRCGFVYARRQPTAEALKEFYHQSQAMSIWAEFKKDNDTHRQVSKFQSVKNFIEHNKPKSVLDIGCGTGVFLSLVQKWSPESKLTGIDSNEESLKVAQKKGIATENKDIFDELGGNRWDLVTAWGLLEHVPDPIRLTKLVSEILEPGGFFVVCVPNVDSLVVRTLWSKCFTFCPQHLWYFDKYSLAKIMKRARLVQHSTQTIESEAIPVIKHTAGFQPYERLPAWAMEKYITAGTIEQTTDFVNQIDAGYKIVAIYQKT